MTNLRTSKNTRFRFQNYIFYYIGQSWWLEIYMTSVTNRVQMCVWEFHCTCVTSKITSQIVFNMKCNCVYCKCTAYPILASAFSGPRITMGSLMITKLIPSQFSLRNRLDYIKNNEFPKNICYVLCLWHTEHDQHSPAPQGLHYINETNSEIMFVV